MALALARAGFGGGDPERILGMRVDIVIAMTQYEAFRADYEKEYIRINSKDHQS